MKQNFKNPVLWSSILSTIFLIFSALGLVHFSDQALNTLINSILSILSIIGILNNPAENTDYNISNSTNNKDNIKIDKK